MTVYWTTNACSLNANTIFSKWDAQGMRKALFTQLFLIFFIYFISQSLHAFVYKNTAQKPAQVRESIRQSHLGKQDTRPDLPWHQKKWNRTFAIMFSNHCVGIGMCILFSPFAGAIIIAYLHFVCFVVYIAMELKLVVFPAKVVRIIIDLFNLSLILIGTTGINYSTCNSDFTCKGVNAGVLTSQKCFGN